MICKILALFRPDPVAFRERFLERFAGRTVIVHQGLTIGWVGELMKEAGGCAHFRFDARELPAHSSELYWMLGEFPECRHLELTAAGTGFAMSRGMPVSDNFVDFDAIFAESAVY